MTASKIKSPSQPGPGRLENHLSEWANDYIWPQRQGIESQTAESFLSPHRQSWKRFSQAVSGPLFGVLYHFGFSQCVFKLWVTPGSLPEWHDSPRHSDRSVSEEEWNRGLVRVTPNREATTGSEGVMQGAFQGSCQLHQEVNQKRWDGHWKASGARGLPCVQKPPLHC